MECNVYFVQRGWCSECLKPLIEDAKVIAEEFSGQCLSEVYIDSNSKLKWICENGHIWKSILGNIKRGRWCPSCIKLKNESKKQLKMVGLQQ